MGFEKEFNPVVVVGDKIRFTFINEERANYLVIDKPYEVIGSFKCEQTTPECKLCKNKNKATVIITCETYPKGSATCECEFEVIK